ARVGGEAGERRYTTDGAREGRGAGTVGREALGAVDRAVEGLIARAGTGERGGGPERDRIIIGLGPGGDDRAAVESGGAARVGREAGERIGGTHRSAKGRRAGAVRRE